MISTTRCKICGGMIEYESSDAAVECQYCGNVTELGEKRAKFASLYTKADDAWDRKDFDEAIALYEEIVNEDYMQAEAHLGIALCRYGIVYEIDPVKSVKMPTCNRINRDSILNDKNYLAAVKHASPNERAKYEARALEIDRISKEFLKIVDKEAARDVFISYKRSDERGGRTLDSQIAKKLYLFLRDKGYNVFFAEESLKEVGGEKYEPYIFAALTSAKVMVLLGSRKDYFEATWVKNEWKRFLALSESDPSKTLIPAYIQCDPYNALPAELLSIQAFDALSPVFNEEIAEFVRKKIESAEEDDEDFDDEDFDDEELDEDYSDEDTSYTKPKRLPKKWIVIAVCVLLVFYLVPNIFEIVTNLDYGNGDVGGDGIFGGETDLTISTPEELMAIAGSSETYKLAGDIDLAGIEWTPISDFVGVLDGDGHSIKNLTIESSESNVGLFSTLSGTVKNLKIENASVTIDARASDIGILCAILHKGSIENVTIDGTLNAKYSSNVGAFAGSVTKLAFGAKVTSLTNNASVTGTDYVGGVFGKVEPDCGGEGDTVDLEKLVNNGKVVGEEYVGGIMAYTHFTGKHAVIHYDFPAHIMFCTNNGDVEGTLYVGGIVGWGDADTTNSTITECENSSNVKGDAYVGCIAGYSVYTVSECSNEGSTLTVEGFTTKDGVKIAYIGGYVGYGEVIKSCTNSVEITYLGGGAYVGGIMGYSDGYPMNTTVSNLKNTAGITGADYVGGIFGYLRPSSNGEGDSVSLLKVENTGNITGYNYVGGIVGYMYFNGSHAIVHYDFPVFFTTVTNSGNVTGETMVGGLVGYGYCDTTAAEFVNSSSSGVVTGIEDFGDIAGVLEKITIR